MARRSYEWCPGETPPLIEAHSLAKHEVLRAYLLTYVEVLTAEVRRDLLRLTLVDGFAGGGQYVDAQGGLHLGSPLLMLNAMREAEVSAQGRRTKPFRLDTRFFFVEKEPQVRAFLRQLLVDEGHGPQIDESIHLLGGEFASHAGDIIERIKGRGTAGRSIFLLDQYGYRDVPLPLIRSIFANLRNAEVVLTFATDWLLDYMSTEDTYRQILKNMGLASFLDDLPSIMENKSRPNWRALAQVSLHENLRAGSGAAHFTPFFIVSEAAHRDYWLIHLSNHARARDEMAKLHWAMQTRFHHYAGHGLSMLGYRAADDPRVTGQQTFAFDDLAEASTRAALRDDIPHALESHPDGIEFSTFFAQECNETPASSTIMADVTRDLSNERAIEVLTPEGKLRRPGAQVRNTDIVRLARQVRLDLGDR